MGYRARPRMQFLALIDFFLPPAARSDLHTAQLTRLLIAACLIDAALEPLMSLRHFLSGNIVGGSVTFGVGLLGIVLLAAIRRGLAATVALDIIGTLVLVGSIVVSLTRGGFFISTVIGPAFIPLIAGLAGRRRAALVWSALAAGGLGGLAVVTVLGLWGLRPETAIDAAPLFIVLAGTTSIAVVHVSTRERLERENDELHRRMALNERLEALGHLAAGVAHDFNNLLTVFRAAGEVLVEELPAEHPLRADAEAIREAAERGATIARQLLAFARPQTSELGAFELVGAIAAMEPILSRALPEAVKLRIEPSPERLHVSGDPSQLMNVLLNLVVNARDAMPNGGHVSIAVTERLVSPTLGRGVLPSGRYAVIQVRDDGSGIPLEALPHIFEPFFTTKTRERGSGLGLATAYGVLRAMKGEITVVDSAADRGTTFELLLPLLDEDALVMPTHSSSRPPAAAARRTVLIVDDQPALVSAARRLLQRDFEVLTAASAAEALEAFRAQPNVDVVLTDVCMPEVGGIELAALLRALKPTVAIVYMTGYSDDEAISREVEAGTARLVRKPFERRSLTKELDRAASRRSS